ncbi:MAG: sulfatase, partial [Planctomycetota bacterium]|nr:sulfatase [Planctomycetota bacterium]
MLRSSALLAVPALLPLVIGGSCGGGGGGPEGPNVLLITVDTLRADRLGCYGYGRDTSPALDRFAEEGVLFERAYAHAPFTAPSHASLFTSLYTDGHGVKNWGYRLDPQAVSFAERFAAGGWRTGAFYNHPTLRSCDLERGFQTVRRRYFEMAEDSIGDLLEWIDSPTEPTKKGAPFAAWLHLWDVHRPYAYRDWSHELLRDKVAREAMQFRYEETRFGTNDDVAVGRTEQFYNLSSTRRERLADEQGLDGDDWAFIGDRYDGGVWYADRALGRLFDELRSRGVLDDTLVIVTSDHGEALTEREACWFTHDPFLHEETLHVPLIVRFPGGEHAGRRVDRLVR